MRGHAVAGFLAAVFPLIATPGASLALLTQRVATDGRRAALAVVLGTATGLYVHASLAALGLSAMVMHSSQAFALVRLTGGVYLVGLGVWTWRSARAEPVPRATARLRWTGRSPYVQALLGNVLNPKAASIYLTLVPQFLTPRPSVVGQLLVLATAHALLVAGWLLVWTVVIGKATGALRSPGFRRTLGRITGAVLFALGLRAATP